MERTGSRPAYLVADLEIRDPAALARYAREVQPVMARYGGRIVALSTEHGRVIEGAAGASITAVHRWRSQADFDEFYASAEYAPLKHLRHGACTSRIAVFDAVRGPSLLPVLQGDLVDVPVAESVRFHSPAADYRGRDDVMHVLRAIARVVGDVVPTRILDDGPARVTTLSGRIGEQDVRGVLDEQTDGSGNLIEASLFLRPYAALRTGIEQMRELLDRDPLPSLRGRSHSGRSQR